MKTPSCRRLIRSVVLFSLSLLLMPSAHIGPRAAAAADFSKDSVVMITVKDAAGNPAAAASGTVLRSDGLVATTCTVVTKWLLGTRHTLRIVTSDGTDMPMIDTLSCDRKTNAALIRIPAEGLTPVIAAKQEAVPKSAVLFSRLSLRDVRKTKLTFSPRKKQAAPIISSTSVSEEQAGGPVLNERGAALGMASIDRTSRTASLVPMDTLFDLYEQYRKLQKKRKQIELLEERGDRSAVHPLPAEVMQARKQVEAQPANPDAHLALGKVCEAARLFDCAVDAYRHVTRLDPARLEGHVGLGLATYRAGRYRESVQAYEQALRVQPRSVAALIKLGAAYLVLGEYPQAVSVLKKAAELEPKNPQTRYNLGVAQFLNGDKSAAMIEYLHLNAVDPERARSLFDLVN